MIHTQGSVFKTFGGPKTLKIKNIFCFDVFWKNINQVRTFLPIWWQQWYWSKAMSGCATGMKAKFCRIIVLYSKKMKYKFVVSITFLYKKYVWQQWLLIKRCSGSYRIKVSTKITFISEKTKFCLIWTLISDLMVVNEKCHSKYF